MTKTKKNSNFLKVVIALIILTMLALIALSGTYAKYTTTTEGSGTAVVAHWQIDFTKDGATEVIENFDVDLANTITSNDAGNTFIQPGSKGTFDITATNNSDVPATFKTTLSDETGTTFTKDQFTFTTTCDRTDVTDNTVILQPGETATVTFDWEWAYDKTVDADADDTAIGESATTPTTIYTVTVTATQVNPNA